MHKYLGYPPEVKALLDIANKCGSFVPDGINPELLWELAMLHDITPLVFNELKKNKDYLPEHIYSELKYDYLVSLFRNSKFWTEFLNINLQLRQKNISFIPIKGIDILARFYPESDLRSMADIDVLIKEEDFNQTQDLLLQMGYQKNLHHLKEDYWKQKQCHITFNKGAFLVEVHWALDFKRDSNIILPKLWQNTRKRIINEHIITLLSAEDALFCFALHLRRFGNILSLKQILDTARIINQSSGFDWDYVLEESRRGKMCATIYFILTQAKLFTLANIPAYVFKKLGLPFWQEKLIKRFIVAYTFKIPAAFKDNYLKAHFLLYDNILEAFWYLINIPYEQFCKFYNLQPYIPKTNLIYAIRLFYCPFRLLTAGT